MLLRPAGHWQRAPVRDAVGGGDAGPADVGEGARGGDAAGRAGRPPRRAAARPRLPRGRARRRHEGPTGAAHGLVQAGRDAEVAADVQLHAAPERPLRRVERARDAPRRRGVRVGADLHPPGLSMVDCRNLESAVTDCVLFAGQAFLAPVECTERRNLVYNFKSLLRRDADGRVVAGVYFAIKALRRGHFSLFYVDEATQRQVDFKVSIDAVLEGGVGADQAEAVRRCERRLRPGGGSLAALLERTAAALADAEFLPQLLDINERVVVLAQNN